MSTAEPDVVACSDCQKELEDCSFCEVRCGHEICWRCLMYRLREEVAEPHTHGG
jgi:hypothetical protein